MSDFKQLKDREMTELKSFKEYMEEVKKKEMEKENER